MAALAAEAGVPVLAPVRPREPDFLAALAALEPDCCPVVAYGALVPRAALDIPRHGWVNLHFSLLPAWRGAAPVQAAVLHGDEVTGASTFQIEVGLDTGPVYGVVTEPVRPRDTAGDLLERLSRSGADLLVRTVDGIEDGTARGRAAARRRRLHGAEGHGRGCGGGLVGAGDPGRPAGPRVYAGARGVDRVRAGPAQAGPGAAGTGRAGARAGGAAGREAAGAGRHRDPSGRARRGPGAGQAADAGAGLGPRRAARPGEPLRRPRDPLPPHAGPAMAATDVGGPRVGETGRPWVARRGRGRERRGDRATAARRRGGPAGRRPGPARPAPRREADPARRVAYDLLRAVDERDAYANLRLPAMLRERGLTGRDAAFATELGYGTLRAAGALDEFLARVRRPLGRGDGPGRAGGAAAGRVPAAAHPGAAARGRLGHRGSGARGGRPGSSTPCCAGWPGRTGTRGSAAVAPRRRARAAGAAHAHPRWIAAAFTDALGGDLRETEAALAADDARPQTHLVARPGRIDRDRLAAEAGGEPGPWSPYAVRLPSGGDPGALAAIRDGRAGVQDEGSQLCALALTRVPLDGPDARWLDLCAGPGGKAALLGSVAALRAPTATGTRRDRPSRAGPDAVVAVEVARTGRGWWRRRPRDCRWTWCARTGPSRPGSPAGPTGSWSTRPAPGSAPCGAVPRPAGAAPRTTWPS